MNRHNIKKITICGFGLIGGCIARDLLSGNYSYEIYTFDRKRVLDRLKKDKTFKGKIKIEYKFNQAIENSDLIILSATHPGNESMLKRIAKSKNLDDCLILDTGAVKSPISKLSQSLEWKNGNQFLATHPMAGREKSGFKNSDSKLFQNHAWYLADAPKLTYTNQMKLNFLIKKLKALPVYINPALHDELVSEISHLPQLISTILGAQINPDLIELAGPGLRSMLRLSGSPYAVWGEIISENKEEIISALQLYADNLNKVIEYIKKDKSLKAIFEDASRSYKCLS